MVVVGHPESDDTTYYTDGAYFSNMWDLFSIDYKEFTDAIGRYLKKKYGSAHINIERISHDRVTDGYYTTESKSQVVFHHNSIWFAELDCDGEPSNYNKNHFVGYLKLIELGYDVPTTWQL